MTRAFAIGAFVFPSFIVLELPILAADFPEVSWLWPVGWRLFGALCFLAGALILRHRHFALTPLIALGASVIAMTATAAALVSWKLGGFASDISDAMAFYFVGVATLMPSPLVQSLVLMMPTYLAYFGGLVALEAVSGAPLVFERGFAFDLLIQLGVCIFAAACSHILWTSRQQLYRARRLGRYRLDALVTRGATSEVWRASEEVRGQAARAVALKIVRAEPGLERALMERFEREARAASALTSEHTIRIYDFGASDDGLAFLAMEPLEGSDLDQHVRRHGPVPPRRAVHLARQVALALIEAHRRGLVHGDLKPSNLHVCDRPGREDHVKVLDWGIARDLGWRSPLVTHEAIGAGTPAVMAPEVFAGNVSPRSDIYAFGASLYWLLTGRYPVSFEPGEGPWAAHQRAQVTAPSVVRDQLFPAGLDQLVLRCLAKLPEERPQDMAQVLAALDALPIKPWSEAEARELWSALADTSEHDPHAEPRAGATRELTASEPIPP